MRLREREPPLSRFELTLRVSVTRDELIALVRRIRDVEGEPAEVRDDLMDVFAENVPHPSGYFLLFSPELVTFEDRQLTDEEVVDIALGYKPFVLGSGDVADDQ